VIELVYLSERAIRDSPVHVLSLCSQKFHPLLKRRVCISSTGLPPRYNKERLVRHRPFVYTAYEIPPVSPEVFPPGSIRRNVCDRANKVCDQKSIRTASSTCAHAIDRMGCAIYVLEKDKHANKNHVSRLRLFSVYADAMQRQREQMVATARRDEVSSRFWGCATKRRKLLKKFVKS
jgi:hypothetical protein